MGWMIFFVLFWGLVRILLYNENNKLNEDLLDPSDYTLSLTGFPIDKSFNEEDFLFQVIKKEFGPDSISRFTFIYDVSEFLKHMDKLSQLKTDKATIEKYRRAYQQYLLRNHLQEQNINSIYPKPKTQFLCCCEEKYKSLENIYREIEVCKNEIYNFVTTHQEQLERISKCYVTLKTPHLLDQIIAKYSSNFWEIICQTSKIKYKEYNIYVQKVPDPEDIVFENLQSSVIRRLLGGLLTLFVSAILLGGCLVANFYILQVSKNFNSNGNFVLSYVITFASSMCIVAVNMIFNKLMPLFCLFEKSHTKTSYNYSVAMKLSIALFLNNAIIPLIAQSPTTYFREGGLLYSIWLNWIIMATVPGLLEILNFAYFFYLIRKQCILSDGKRSSLTQIEANHSLEPVSIYLPTLYSDSSGLLLYTAFYLCFFPAGILLTIGGLLFTYLVNKAVFLYRYKKPEKVSGNICLRSVGLIGYGCLSCFMASNITFSLLFGYARSFTFSEWIYTFAPLMLFIIILIVFSILYIFFYNYSWIRAIMGSNELSPDFVDKYTNCEYDILKFGLDDYKALFPITKVKAHAEVLEINLINAKTEDEKKFLATNINQLNARTTLSKIGTYINKNNANNYRQTTYNPYMRNLGYDNYINNSKNNNAKTIQPNNSQNVNNSQYFLQNNSGNYKEYYANDSFIQSPTNNQKGLQNYQRQVYPLALPRENIPYNPNTGNKIYPSNIYRVVNNPLSSAPNNVESDNFSTNYNNIPAYNEVLRNYNIKK